MKYQIKMLGTPWRVDELHNILSDFPSIDFLDADKDGDDLYPILYLYYGNSKVDAIVNEDLVGKLESFVKKRLIQPIGRVSDDFKDKFPTCLKGLNGFFLNESSYSILSLKNLILSYFGILDGTRKVFISYHREETEVLAHKLYDLLIKNKYFPFLDAYSIRPGVDFQQYLRHELMSSDIMILLDTPGFNSSEYCMEEFNIANEECIPVLDVRFNIDQRNSIHQFCEYFETDMDASEGNEDEELPVKILEIMERSRAKAFCSKRKFILDEFNFQCNKFGMNIIEEGGFFRCDTTHECFIPLTHIPQASDLYDTKSMVESTPLFSTYSKQILYNGNYCRPDIANQLAWWNEHLPIKTYNITK